MMPAVVDGAARMVLRAVNHLLAQEAWAARQLAPFADQQIVLSLGATAFRCQIAGDGSLRRVSEDTSGPAVHLQLPVGFLRQALQDPQAARAQILIAGPAELAEAVGQVFRNLRWHPEDDLAKVVGDIAAHRLGSLLRQGVTSLGEGARRLEANVQEYLADGDGNVPARHEFDAWQLGIASVQEDIQRLVQRLSVLNSF